MNVGIDVLLSNLLSQAIALSVILFFINRLLKLRDTREKDMKHSIELLQHQVVKLQTQVAMMIAKKLPKNDYLIKKGEENELEKLHNK